MRCKQVMKKLSCLMHELWSNRRKRSALFWGLGYLFVLLCGAGLVYYWRLIYGFNYFTTAAATLLVCAFFSAMYAVVFATARFVPQSLPIKAGLLIFFAGLCFTAANPPLQAPDETMHFVRAYALGSGDFTFDKNRDYPKDVDALVQAFPGFYYSELVATEKRSMPQGFELYYDLLSGEEPMREQASTLTQQFLYYLPQAGGIALGRLFGADALVCMYLARAVNLLVYAFFCALAVYCASSFVPLLIALAASPPALFIVSSCSPDALFLGACWLFIGICLSDCFSKKRAAALVVCFALMYCTKNTAIAMLPMIALVPQPQGLSSRWNKLTEKSWRYQTALGAVCLAAALILFQALSLYTSLVSNYGRVEYALEGIDGGAQLAFILSNPIRYIAVFLYSLYRDKANLFSSGAFGWMDLVEPFVNYFTPLVWMFAAALCARDGAKRGMKTAWVMLICALGMYAVTYTGLYLTSTPVTLREINGVQTRYMMTGFFALFALAAILIGRSDVLQDTQRQHTAKTPPAWRMLHFSYCFAVVCAILLFQNYYIGTTI